MLSACKEMQLIPCDLLWCLVAAAKSSCVFRRYTGEKLLDERLPVLLEAGWRPAPVDAFPDLPQSPRSNGSTASSAPPVMPQRAAGYVAPHLRGSGVNRPMWQYPLMLRVTLLVTRQAHAPPTAVADAVDKHVNVRCTYSLGFCSCWHRCIGKRQLQSGT